VYLAMRVDTDNTSAQWRGWIAVGSL